MYSCEIFENVKNISFEEHLRTTASERLRKISPLLLVGKAMLDLKYTTEQQMLFIENLNVMKLVCAIFTLYQNTLY